MRQSFRRPPIRFICSIATLLPAHRTCWPLQVQVWLKAARLFNHPSRRWPALLEAVSPISSAVVWLDTVSMKNGRSVSLCMYGQRKTDVFFCTCRSHTLRKCSTIKANSSSASSRLSS